jgi:hypothetical protein
MQGQNIVKINIPDLEKVDKHIHEAIHSNYNAQIINNDIFIKCDGKNKEDVQAKLLVSAMAHNLAWSVSLNTICVAGGNSYQPDIGIWFQMPTYAQRNSPIINRCPPPNVYIEVFYNQDPDRRNALERITNVQRTHHAVEFIGIALPKSTYPFHQNPFPWAVTVPATQQLNQRPNQAPYIIHWDANQTPIYYIMDWNEHLPLRCGWTLEFNLVLSVIAHP